MKVVLAGPVLTSALASFVPEMLVGAPPGTNASPIVPLAAALLAANHDVHIVTTDATIDSPKTFYDRSFSITYCPLRGAPRYRARERSFDLFEKEVCYIKAAIEAAAPDIVHAHWTYEFAEAAVRTGLPHLVTMHDLGWEYFWQFRDAYRFMRLIMKYRTMPRIRNLSVVAPFMASKARQYGYFGEVAVIPNGVAVPDTLPTKALDPKRPVIVTVGNSGHLKNVRKSVEALAAIRARLPGAEMHLFGPGLDESFTQGAPGVIGHGNVDHTTLLDFLARQATVLIHPSRLETFGVIIAEAKVRGVPVIAGAKSGGVPFVCGTNQGSVLVDIENLDAIATAAIDIVSSEKAYNAMSLQAIADVRDRFDSDKVTEQYLRAYQDVLGS